MTATIETILLLLAVLVVVAVLARRLRALLGGIAPRDARAPEVPTSMATRTLADGLFMRSAADQLGAGLVPVQGDQRAVEGAGGVVAARVDDHGLARPEAADA